MAHWYQKDPAEFQISLIQCFQRDIALKHPGDEMKIKTFLVSALIGLGVVGAHASLVSADFRNESNVPDYFPGLPLVYESLGQSVGAGVELTGADLLANPSSWMGGVVLVDFNPLTNVLTLSSQDTWDFETFSANISNAIFSQADEKFTGISLIRGAIIDKLVPVLSFTDNSLNISYASPGFAFTGDSASFQVTIAHVSPVPEPGNRALLLGGLGMLGCAAVRRRNTKGLRP